jgi:hypothetical protein
MSKPHIHSLKAEGLETLDRQTQQQAQLSSDEFDDDELSEQELELVAGGGLELSVVVGTLLVEYSSVPNKLKPKPPLWPW